MLENFNISLTWSSHLKLDGMINMKEQWKLQANWKLKLELPILLPKNGLTKVEAKEKNLQVKGRHRWACLQSLGGNYC
jgi:hypothetical protein